MKIQNFVSFFKPMKTTNFVSLLSGFVYQRPGFNLCNYGTFWDYRTDYYQASKFKEAYDLLLSQAEKMFYFEDLNKKLGDRLKNNSGRLSFNTKSNNLEYCTGQYFPTETEYRRAAFYVLLYTVLDLIRDLLESKPELKDKVTISEARQYLTSRTKNEILLDLLKD
jgi:hypothetical protein